MGVEDPFNPAVRPLTAAAAAGDPSVAPPLLQTLADFASAELARATPAAVPLLPAKLQRI